MALGYLPLLLSAVGTGAKIGMDFLFKPKKLKPDTTSIDKYIDNLHSNMGDATMRNLAVENANAGAGAIMAETNRNQEYQNNIRGLTGSGVAAQEALSRTTAAIDNTNKVVTEVNKQEVQRQGDLQDNLAKAYQMRDGIVQQYRDQNRANTDNWNRQLVTDAVSGAIDIGTAGLNMYAANQALEQEFNALLGSGELPSSIHTLDEYKIFKNMYGAGAGAVLQGRKLTEQTSMLKDMYENIPGVMDAMNLLNQGIIDQKQASDIILKQVTEHGKMMKTPIGTIESFDDAGNKVTKNVFPDATGSIYDQDFSDNPTGLKKVEPGGQPKINTKEMPEGNGQKRIWMQDPVTGAWTKTDQVIGEAYTTETVKEGNYSVTYRKYSDGKRVELSRSQLITSSIKPDKSRFSYQNKSTATYTPSDWQNLVNDISVEGTDKGNTMDTIQVTVAGKTAPQDLKIIRNDKNVIIGLEWLSGKRLTDADIRKLKLNERINQGFEAFTIMQQIWNSNPPSNPNPPSN